MCGSCIVTYVKVKEFIIIMRPANPDYDYSESADVVLFDAARSIFLLLPTSK